MTRDMNELNVEGLLKSEGLGKKRFSGKKVLKGLGIGLLTTAVMAGATVAIQDSNVDHTNTFCSLAQLNNIENPIYGTMGVEHQVEEMRKEYAAKGLDVIVQYEPCYMQRTVEKSDALEGSSERVVFEIYDAIFVHDRAGNIIEQVKIPRDPDLDYLYEKNKRKSPTIEVVEGGDIELSEDGPKLIFKTTR